MYVCLRETISLTVNKTKATPDLSRLMTLGQETRWVLVLWWVLVSLRGKWDPLEKTKTQ